MTTFEPLSDHFNVREMDALQDHFHAKKLYLSARQHDWMESLLEKYDERGLSARVSETAINFIQEGIDGKFNKR